MVKKRFFKAQLRNDDRKTRARGLALRTARNYAGAGEPGTGCVSRGIISSATGVEGVYCANVGMKKLFADELWGFCYSL